ncbi:MAG: hypothetical protein QHH02_09225 [Syntrophomonadaceae bacterium]|nr:hypothetical protein [Syntrophomonadaceae bacterium]
MPGICYQFEKVFWKSHHGHGHGRGGHRHEQGHSRLRALLRSRARPVEQPQQPTGPDQAGSSAVKPPAASGEGLPAKEEKPPQ